MRHKSEHFSPISHFASITLLKTILQEASQQAVRLRSTSGDRQRGKCWRQRVYLCHTTHWLLWYPSQALGLTTAVTLSLLRLTENHQTPSHWGSFQMLTCRLMRGPCLTHTPSPPVPRSKPGLRDRTSSQGSSPYFFPRPLCLCLVPLFPPKPGRQLMHHPQNRAEIAIARGTPPWLVSGVLSMQTQVYVIDGLSSCFAHT